MAKRTNTTHTGRGYVPRRQTGDVNSQKAVDDVRNRLNDVQSMLGGLEGKFNDSQKSTLQFRRTDSAECPASAFAGNGSFSIKLPHRLNRPYEGAIIVEESRDVGMKYAKFFVLGPTGEEAEVVEVYGFWTGPSVPVPSGSARFHLLVY